MEIANNQLNLLDVSIGNDELLHEMNQSFFFKKKNDNL